MSVRVETQNDLGVDLATKHKIYHRPDPIDPTQTQADFEVLMRDGLVILEDLLNEEQIATLKHEASLHLNHCGRNNFEGHKTQRIYGVFTKMRSVDPLAEHPRVLALLDKLFLPNYRLSQAQVINILPGEEAQPLHYDDGFYRWPRPRPALGAATILAVDDFTEENGGTAYIPGSHTWGEDRQPMRKETLSVAMKAGSAILFLGTLWHGGGANHSNAPRLAATCQYCEPWLRQQVNYTLEVPKETVIGLSEPMKSMLGYSIHPPFMGMVDGMHPKRLLK
jgi:ectoine hydroxylase-related dioxygenase (phytanoyl-CoA dioxygenase family)